MNPLKSNRLIIRKYVIIHSDSLNHVEPLNTKFILNDIKHKNEIYLPNRLISVFNVNCIYITYIVYSVYRNTCFGPDFSQNRLITWVIGPAF